MSHYPCCHWKYHAFFSYPYRLPEIYNRLLESGYMYATDYGFHGFFSLWSNYFSDGIGYIWQFRYFIRETRQKKFFSSLVERIKMRHKRLEKYTSTIECVKRSAPKEETSRYIELPWWSAVKTKYRTILDAIPSYTLLQQANKFGSRYCKITLYYQYTSYFDQRQVSFGLLCITVNREFNKLLIPTLNKPKPTSICTWYTRYNAYNEDPFLWQIKRKCMFVCVYVASNIPTKITLYFLPFPGRQRKKSIATFEGSQILKFYVTGFQTNTWNCKDRGVWYREHPSSASILVYNPLYHWIDTRVSHWRLKHAELHIQIICCVSKFDNGNNMLRYDICKNYIDYS